jgi:hypothetical protein
LDLARLDIGESIVLPVALSAALADVEKNAPWSHKGALLLAR